MIRGLIDSNDRQGGSFPLDHYRPGSEIWKARVKGYKIHDGSAHSPCDPEEQPGVLMKDGRVIKKGELKAKWVDWTEVLGYKISRFHSPKTFATDL